MRIAVGVPSHDFVNAGFAYDLAKLSAFTVAALPDDTEFGNMMVSGTYIHVARRNLLEQALADGVDWLLWLDSDMRFPKDALVRLLQRREPFVGINYSTRRTPLHFVALRSPFERLVTGPDSTGLEPVDALGFGLFLMRVRDVAQYPEAPSWFGYPTEETTGQMVGEDVNFCRQLRERGHTIYVDHDLSRECKHIGSFEFGTEHAAAWAEEVAAR